METLVFLNGIFSLVFVIISTIVGLTIASRYFKYKRPIFLYMGFSWVIIVSPWWPSSISVILALITDKGLTLRMYILIGNILIPIGAILLTTSLTELKYQEKQKVVLIIFIIIGILFEIYLIYFFFVDPTVLGTLNGLVDIKYSGILMIYLIFNIIVFIVVGMLISHDSIQSDVPELKLKGKFLLTSIIIWTIGTLFDGFLSLTIITLIIIRIILILSSILFYFAFLLPNWMKRLLIKESLLIQRSKATTS